MSATNLKLCRCKSAFSSLALNSNSASIVCNAAFMDSQFISNKLYYLVHITHYQLLCNKIGDLQRTVSGHGICTARPLVYLLLTCLHLGLGCEEDEAACLCCAAATAAAGLSWPARACTRSAHVLISVPSQKALKGSRGQGRLPACIVLLPLLLLNSSLAPWSAHTVSHSLTHTHTHTSHASDPPAAAPRHLAARLAHTESHTHAHSNTKKPSWRPTCCCSKTYCCRTSTHRVTHTHTNTHTQTQITPSWYPPAAAPRHPAAGLAHTESHTVTLKCKKSQAGDPPAAAPRHPAAGQRPGRQDGEDPYCCLGLLLLTSMLPTGWGRAACIESSAQCARVCMCVCGCVCVCFCKLVGRELRVGTVVLWWNVYVPSSACGVRVS